MTAEQYKIEEADLLKDVPEEFRGAMSYKAYEDGHAYGYEEVLNHLQGLVADFKEPIKKYTERLLKEKNS